MRVSTSACFSFALAALTLALPNTSALAFDKSSDARATDILKAGGETRQERAAREAAEARELQSERQHYRRCPEGQGCSGSRKEPGAMTMIFPAG
jgi:hypothetical protein